jgi:molecular chaperone GrpE
MFRVAVAAACVATSAIIGAHAQTFPSRQVTLIATPVGFALLLFCAGLLRAYRRRELRASRAEAETAREDSLRALAELENVRKRARRDVEHAHKFALERFAAELLGVKDSLEMGLEAAAGGGGDVDRLREGKEATLKQLSAVLERFGIGEIDPAGEAFNPELHEAMSMQESAEAEPDSVLAVIQKGYTLHGRLLRPARVIVARAPEPDADGA